MLASATTRQGNRAPINARDLGPQWIFQPKFDGVRCIAEYDALRQVWTAYSRAGNRFRFTATGTEDRGTWAATWWAANVGWPDHDMVLDGEVVANSFTELAPWIKAPHSRVGPTGLRYVVFDMLEYAGRPLIHSPLDFRLGMVEQFQFHQGGRLTYADAMARSKEGAVAKRLDSLYEPGARSRDWLKFKREYHVTAIAYRRGGDGTKRSIELAIPTGVGSIPLLSIGPVGSGLTDDSFAAVVDRMPCVVEISASARTPDDGLRFPVFRRIRSDLELADVTADEYFALPLY